MATELSSNWKKLQATLKQESKASSDRKRKAEPTERQQNTIAKRRRLDDKTTKGGREYLGRKKSMEKGGNRPLETEDGSDSTRQDPPAPSASLALWAEENNISAKDLAEAYGGGLKDTTVLGTREDLINGGLFKDVEIGKYVGIDCEMVGVGGAENRSVLARISIVNFHGTQVYDSFVRPKEFVTDWRTQVSGVSTKNMPTARSFEEVQKVVADILKDRILVGHAVHNDLEALMLGHPKRDIRDTQKFNGFREYGGGNRPRLKTLAKEILGVEIQGGEHSSIEDARATMLLFRRHKSAFDVEHAQRYPTRSAAKKPKSKKKKKGKR